MNEKFRTLDTFRKIIQHRNFLFNTLLHFEISSLARWRLIISPKGEKISFKSASSISLNKNENFVKTNKINSVSSPSASSEIKISKINFQEFSTGVKSQKPGLVRRLTGRVQLHLTRSKIGPNLAQRVITFHRLGCSSHLYDKDGEFVFKRKPIRKFTRKKIKISGIFTHLLDTTDIEHRRTLWFKDCWVDCLQIWLRLCRTTNFYRAAPHICRIHLK